MSIQMFPTKIMKIGNSLGIIIPSNYVKFTGAEEGDEIKFYFKKTK